MVRIPYENWNLIKHTSEFWANCDDNISLEQREIGVIHQAEYADPNNPDPNNLKYFTVLPKFLLHNNKDIVFHDNILSEAYDIFKNMPDRSAHVDFKFMWDLRDEQVPLIDDVLFQKETKGYINGLIIANPGFGKGLLNMSKIPSPNGWVRVGDVKVGDKLFDKRGRSTNVLGVFPQGLKDIYKIEFDDGTTTLCDDEHLWEITFDEDDYHLLKTQFPEGQLPTSIFQNYKSVLSSKYIDDILNNWKPQVKMFVELCSPVKFNISKHNVVPPRVKGCFISKDFGYNISHNKNVQNFNLTRNYQAIKLNDYISDNYKYSTIDERKELISNIFEDNCFICKSKKMALDILEICESLGIYHYPLDINKYYDEDEEIEVERYMIVINPLRTRKRIINIELYPSQFETTCFAVDNDEKLFLCNNYTVTHNTASSIKIAELIGKQTCVVVPNDLLEKQWVESIKKSTNLEYEDIGVIQGSDFDKLNKDNVYSKPIVIVKVQSLLSQLKSYNLNSLYELYSRFGLVFYDEVHTSGSAESYAKTSFIFETKNVIGLTATPYIKGINKFLLNNSIGDVIHHSDHQNLIADCHMHHLYLDFTEYEINKLRSMFNLDYVMFMATLNNILESKQAYFDYLAQWILYYISQGRKIAVLFSNNKLITKMANTLKALGHGDCYGILIGETDGKKKVYPDYINQESYDIFKTFYKNVFPKKKKVPELKRFTFEKDATPEIIKYKFTAKQLEDINAVNAFLNGMSFDLIKIEKVENILTDRQIQGQKPVTMSNFILLKAGYDDTELSVALFGSLVIGKITVNQTIGRITRLHDGKETPQAHFFFPWIYTQFLPQNHFILTNNIKIQYPTTHFSYENFPRAEKVSLNMPSAVNL